MNTDNASNEQLQGSESDKTVNVICDWISGLFCCLVLIVWLGVGITFVVLGVRNHDVRLHAGIITLICFLGLIVVLTISTIQENRSKALR